MSHDDSLNDSDEIFNLYSSKSITETFRAQLKKIVASNRNLVDASQKDIEDVCTEKDKNTSKEISVVVKEQEVNSSQKTTTKKIDDVSSNSCTTVSKDDSLDDSIEVIEEFTPKPVRQSKRLKKKREENSFVGRESSSTHSDVVVIGQLNRGRPRSKKRRQKRGKPVQEITLDDSPQPAENEDELNPEVSVKVIWKSVNIKKFMIRKFQKLSHIYELLSKEENIAKDKIILTFNNVMVNQNDTPDSLNLQVYHFLDGGVLNESTNLCTTSESNTHELNSESVMLRFQDINKRIVTVHLNKNDKLKIGMIMCSEQLEIPLNKISFFFDGELVQPSETPESLGLEGGEVIDMKITGKQ